MQKKRGLAALLVEVGLILLLALSPAWGQSSSCGGGSSQALVLRRVAWSYDPTTRMLDVSGEVLNVGGSPVRSPGLLVIAYDAGGKELDQGWKRGAREVLKPGQGERIRFTLKIRAHPDGIKAVPLAGLTGT